MRLVPGLTLWYYESTLCDIIDLHFTAFGQPKHYQISSPESLILSIYRIYGDNSLTFFTQHVKYSDYYLLVISSNLMQLYINM